MIEGAGLAGDAGRAQRRAADPAASVWVAASAGTGKTKVLADRVLSLLLAGTRPHKILCLTFTKAAAAEMANRIARNLADWAVMDEAALAGELAGLLGRPADAGQTVEARRLFARVLDAPGGLAIETIHAFCQSLLRRFPVEAGLAPHFQVMDDRDAGEMLEAAKEDILVGGGAVVAAVAGRIHETHFPELLAELVGARGRLQRLLDGAGGLDGAVASMRARLGLEPGEDEAAILAAASAETAFDGAALRRAVPALSEGGKGDNERAAAMAAWLAADQSRRMAGFAAYGRAYLTQGGEVRKALATKAVQARHPGIVDDLTKEAERLIRVGERLRAASVAEATAALLALADRLLAAYSRRKEARAALDYDDLILRTRTLLARPGVAPWVLFKLDGGIDHVLIDEAQDTNPDQWAVVRALVADFFAGAGARDDIRTVFAVGDVKQSIYSFQGADPAAFESMRDHFRMVVGDARLDWREIPLNVSFRSTRAVLDAVDAVFAETRPGRDGVAHPGEDIGHLAQRMGQAGSVEIWPPVAPRALEPPPPWKPPVDRIRGDSPSTRLAGLMAARIEAMIGTERLDSRNRPVRAGDILVLVRRRGGFVEDLVRALKQRRVAVAGADRMVLTDQLVVMDLMALARVLLLPEDDLTLATVLKGPLIGLTEEQLFHLAWDRGPQTLWEALRARMGADPAFENAWATLGDLMAKADRLTPHNLFAHILGPLGGKRRLLARLGAEAEDPLDEFIALTLAFERAHPPSLQGFLRWLEAGAVEIKRDLDQGVLDAVRIMTVHGAKGLQAPIVFLPDTMQVPKMGDRLLWVSPQEPPAAENRARRQGDDIVLWPPRADMADPVCLAGREAQKQARDREFHRLLYVAMTRACDRLIVCGWQTGAAPAAGCWYDLIRDAVAGLAAEIEDPFLAAAGETEGATVLRLKSAQDAPFEKDEAAAAAGVATMVALPALADRPPPPEPLPPRPLAPSRPEGDEPPVRSPLEGEADHRFRRGRLIHRLLQTLPDLEPDVRDDAARRFLDGFAADLDPALRAAIAAEVASVLNHPAFAPLFAPGSRAEVPVAGRIGDGAIAGMVDRLAVTDDAVLVADYKTNRRPPGPGEAPPPVYVRQMAAYRAALSAIYPDRPVRCALVWTDGPAVTEIAPALMDEVLRPPAK